AGILVAQSLRDNSDSGTRRRDTDRRDDRDLPLYRGAMAGAEPIWLNRARAGDDRDVAAPARMAAPLTDRPGRASRPSENGGDGEPASSRLGGSQSAEGASRDDDCRSGLARPAVHRWRPFYRRRYHWPVSA